MAKGTRRACSTCGETYHRRNLVQVWDTRNVGHRDGWHQTTIKVCLRCQTPKSTQQMLRVATVASFKPLRALRRAS
jgi:hypothetical protein